MKISLDSVTNFRPRHCLINLTDYIKGEIRRGNLVGMVVIDLKKAFDTVDGEILLQKLAAMGVTSLDWFRSYFREQCTQVDGINSSFLQVTCGVPQGSILGPTLFLCYVNDMSTCLKCQLSLYADDSALIFSGKDPGTIGNFLSGELSSCRQWLIDNRLTLHVGKTESILFGTSRKVKKADNFLVNCDGETVSRVTSVIYLGVRLDQCLKFEDFIIKTCNDANSRLSFLYRYNSMLDHRTRKLLCSTLILSKLSYCVSAWYSGLGVGLRNRLDVVQRKMIRFMNGWGPREHVGSAEFLSTGWLTFSKRASFFQLCHVLKIRSRFAPSYLSRDFCPMQDIHLHNTRGSELNYFVDADKFPPGTFHYTAVREWNKLPDEIKRIRSLPTFKGRLKCHFS